MNLSNFTGTFLAHMFAGENQSHIYSGVKFGSDFVLISYGDHS